MPDLQKLTAFAVILGSLASSASPQPSTEILLKCIAPWEKGSSLKHDFTYRISGNKIETWSQTRNVFNDFCYSDWTVRTNCRSEVTEHNIRFQYDTNLPSDRNLWITQGATINRYTGEYIMFTNPRDAKDSYLIKSSIGTCTRTPSPVLERKF